MTSYFGLYSWDELNRLDARCAQMRPILIRADELRTLARRPPTAEDVRALSQPERAFVFENLDPVEWAMTLENPREFLDEMPMDAASRIEVRSAHLPSGDFEIELRGTDSEATRAFEITAGQYEQLARDPQLSAFVSSHKPDELYSFLQPGTSREYRTFYTCAITDYSVFNRLSLEQIELLQTAGAERGANHFQRLIDRGLIVKRVLVRAELEARALGRIHRERLFPTGRHERLPLDPKYRPTRAPTNPAASADLPASTAPQTRTQATKE